MITRLVLFHLLFAIGCDVDPASRRETRPSFETPSFDAGLVPDGPIDSSAHKDSNTSTKVWGGTVCEGFASGTCIGRGARFCNSEGLLVEDCTICDNCVPGTACNAATKGCEPVEGTLYWVSPTGNATWSGCQSATALQGTAACDLATANASAKAGDTVVLRGGRYEQTLRPSHSGKPEVSHLPGARWRGGRHRRQRLGRR